MERPPSWERVRAGVPIAILLLVGLGLPGGQASAAASGGLSLDGPAQVSAIGPTLVTLDLTLRLRHVVCANEIDLPVALSLARADGVDARLPWNEILFRLAPHSAAESWTGTSEIALRIDPEAPSGFVEVLARYDLPSGCVALGGATSGEARHLLRIDAWTAGAAQGEPLATTPAQAPPHRAPPPPAQTEDALPAPVIGAILGMCAGGLVVVVKRVRARSASFEA